MTPRATVSEQLAMQLAGVLETRDLPRACWRCDWQRLATGGWQMHRADPRCIVHGDGCRRCRGRGEIKRSGYVRTCPACLGRGIRSKGEK